MTSVQRRLKKLDQVFTDPTGIVPNTRRWLEYWDVQYSLFLTGKDPNAIRESSVAEYRAVMKYADENPAALVRRFLERSNVQKSFKRLQQLERLRRAAKGLVILVTRVGAPDRIVELSANRPKAKGGK